MFQKIRKLYRKNKSEEYTIATFFITQDRVPRRSTNICSGGVKYF